MSEKYAHNELGPRGSAHLRPLSLKELMAQKFPPNPWIVEQLIPMGITVLSAMPGSGKTWMLLDMAIKVACDEAIYDRFRTQQTGVLIIDEENGPALLQDRFRSLGLDSTADLPIHVMALGAFKADESYVNAVVKFCKRHDIGLVMIDALVRIHTKDENSAGDMANVFQVLKELPKHGIALLITHHNRKEINGRRRSGQEMRGSSDILAAVDCQLSIERDGENVSLTQNKLRTARELEGAIHLLLVSTDEGVAIRYVGTDKRRGSQEQTVKDQIIRILQQKSCNQKELHAALLAHGSSVGIRSLQTYLMRMVVSGAVIWRGAKGKTKIYSLAGVSDV